MSEFEKQQREAHQRKRQRWIMIQTIIIGVLVLGLLITSLLYYKLNKETYVYYTEEGNVIHRAYLTDNEFYDDSYLNGSHAYLTSLIEKMTGDFTYKLKLDASDVNFKYSYKIEAQLVIAEKTSGTPIYNPIYELVPEQTVTKNGNTLSIHELVDIDYNAYDALAKKFLEQSKTLESLTSQTLYVRMHVEVLGMSEQFAENNTGEYVVELSVPLNAAVAKPSVSTSVPAAEQKILVRDDNAQAGFLIAAIILGVLSLIAGAILAIYAYKTRDMHINYARKVQKIVSAYKSYIQKIRNPFDTDGYQVLYVDTFTEMLEIRDTLQIPVLMYENDDKTCTHFMIVSGSVLYVYEIKVEHYDKLYNTGDLPMIEETQDDLPIIEDVDFEEENVAYEEAPVMEEMSYLDEEEVTVIEEVPVLLEEVDEELLAEAMAEPTIELEEIEFVDVIDEEVKEEEEGVEIIGVVWPERQHKNKVYRYDPNGEVIADGDIVLIPSRDVHRNRDIIRKAVVVHGNHRVAPETLLHPLKKVIAVIHRIEHKEIVHTEAPVEPVENTEVLETVAPVEVVEDVAAVSEEIACVSGDEQNQ